MVILDTNVVSELIRPVPDIAVVERLGKIDAASVYTTSITEAELWYGVETAPVGKRRRDLKISIHKILVEEFADRILPFDSAAAMAFGVVMALLEKQGQNPDWADAQIAAIAMSRGYAVATRNIKHFEGSGVSLINPWAG